MNIYVGNLSLDVTEEELRREFMAFGEVISVVIMNNKYIGSGQTRGYGFVEMASKSEGEAAITSLKGKRLKSRVVRRMPQFKLRKRQWRQLRRFCETWPKGPHEISHHAQITESASCVATAANGNW